VAFKATEMKDKRTRACGEIADGNIAAAPAMAGLHLERFPLKYRMGIF
jgi:hypothetical protein